MTAGTMAVAWQHRRTSSNPTPPRQPAAWGSCVPVVGQTILGILSKSEELLPSAPAECDVASASGSRLLCFRFSCSVSNSACKWSGKVINGQLLSRTSIVLCARTM